MEITPLQTAALLIAVTFVGALLPLHRRWSERGLHLLVSVSAGIFLGTVFLHLLPHLAGMGTEAAASDLHAAERGGRTIAPWVAALAGLLVLFVLEKVWLPTISGSSGHDPHRALWRVTWVGLALHAIAEGVALAAVLETPGAPKQLLFPILIHKATESFSLATVMRLAHLGSGRSVTYLLAFAGLGPLGLLLGSSLATSGGSVDSVLTGFACGTFLYVAVCDLLPEVFHGADRPVLKVASVVAGILATAVTGARLDSVAEFGMRVGRESWGILLQISPYLLLGFLIAGVLNQFMKTDWLTRHVSGENLKSVTLASLIGAPLPLCSCSVVPVAVQMRRGGASKGATTAFLIATPETGVDSVTVSWALLGPFLTVARFLGAILSAIFTGAVVSWFVRSRGDEPLPVAMKQARGEESGARCDAASAQAGAPRHVKAPAEVDAPAQVDAAAHAHDKDPAPALASRGPQAWWGRVLRYAFVEMMDDLAPSLVVGILLSGLIAAAVPPEVFQSPVARGFPGLLLMLAIGIPIYVCAAASTPIAAALILKGMSPGAAFVFLLASPATNLGSLVVLSKHLGRRVVLLQVAALSVVTLALGWIVDQIHPWFGIVLSVSPVAGPESVPAWLTLGSTLLLATLIAIALVRARGTRSLLYRVRGLPQPVAP